MFFCVSNKIQKSLNPTQECELDIIVIVNLERTSRGRMRRADESRDSLAASFEVRPRRISAAYVMDQRAAIRCGEEMLDFLA